MMTGRRLGFSLLALWVMLIGRPVLAAAAPGDDSDSLPNVFISPCGEPFRAPSGAPYPVADWFKKADANHDGRLDRAEFVADAAAFFKVLDLNGDGALSHYEVAVYEQRVAPEILGLRVKVGDVSAGARPWLAQYGSTPPIVPQGDEPAAPARPKGLDESGQGASPFGLFEEPEPVMAANLDVNGIIRRANFVKLAQMHFDALDADGVGYLTLSKLPKTTVQKAIERSRPRRGRA